MASAERVELVEKHGKGMLLDTKLLGQFRERSEIHRFGTVGELVLDVSELTAEDAAKSILWWVQYVADAKVYQ